MSSLIAFLNRIFGICNPVGGVVKKLLLVFVSFLLMMATFLTMPLVVTMPAYANETSIDLWQSFPDNQGDNGFFTYGYAPVTNTYWLFGISRYQQVIDL